jgi:hypothetical protein
LVPEVPVKHIAVLPTTAHQPQLSQPVWQVGLHWPDVAPFEQVGCVVVTELHTGGMSMLASAS